MPLPVMGLPCALIEEIANHLIRPVLLPLFADLGEFSCQSRIWFLAACSLSAVDRLSGGPSGPKSFNVWSVLKSIFRSLERDA